MAHILNRHCASTSATIGTRLSLPDAHRSVRHDPLASGEIRHPAGRKRLAGAVNQAYELLMDSDLRIQAEVILHVHHALMAPPGVKLEDVKRARSHPQALAQCEKFLRRYNIEPMPWYDTAGSAKDLAAEQATVTLLRLPANSPPNCTSGNLGKADRGRAVQLHPLLHPRRRRSAARRNSTRPRWSSPRATARRRSTSAWASSPRAA